MSTRSGFCQFAVHDRCPGTAAGVPCSCSCHQPADQRPAARLERAAALLDRTDQPPPPSTGPALAQLLRAEATWAGDRITTYPADRAPLLALADQILESTP